jgi:tetratricopeptide (TPR) repeat protein
MHQPWNIRILTNLFRYDEAEAILERGLKTLNPVDPRLYNALGILKCERGDLAGGAKAFRKALRQPNCDAKCARAVQVNVDHAFEVLEKVIRRLSSVSRKASRVLEKQSDDVY